MANKKSTKKPSKKAAVKKAGPKPVKVIKKAIKKVKEKVAKVLSAANGKNTVAISSAPTVTDGKTRSDRGIPHLVVEDKDHSISVEQAAKIAGERKTHDDERPPNSELSIPEIISQAWDEVRGDDPPLAECVPSHIEKVYSHAQVIIAGGSPMSGDTRLALLEQAVSRLTKEKN